MELFRKKPVVIQAMQWNSPEDDNRLGEFLSVNGWGAKWCHNSNGFPCIQTLESGNGFHVVSPGDYVIKGVSGEFYPCKPDIFDQTYDLVEECENCPAIVDVDKITYTSDDVPLCPECWVALKDDMVKESEESPE